MTSTCRAGAWEVEVPGSGRRKLKWSSAPSVWALHCLWQVWQLGSEDVGLDFSREVGPGQQANPGFQLEVVGGIDEDSFQWVKPHQGNGSSCS